MDRCEECGFEYDLTRARNSGALILSEVGLFCGLLQNPEIDVRARPAPDTWSTLEYSCHVRDVLLVQRERALAARRTDCPSVAPMGRDERAEHDGYAAQDPIRVAGQLADAALLFSNVLARLAPDDWDRTLIYNYPEPTERSLHWLAIHTEHEVRHHLRDVQEGLG